MEQRDPFEGLEPEARAALEKADAERKRESRKARKANREAARARPAFVFLGLILKGLADGGSGEIRIPRSEFDALGPDDKATLRTALGRNGVGFDEGRADFFVVHRPGSFPPDDPRP